MKRIASQCLFLVLSLFALRSGTADVPPPKTCRPFDDWISCPETPSLCGGYYQEATPPYPDATEDFLVEQPTTLTSDRGEFQDQGPSTVQGNVHLIQGNRQVMADRAIIYRNASTNKIETIKTPGFVKILEPGLRLEGTDAEISVLDDRKTIHNAEFRIYERHARGCASQITAEGKTRFTLCDARYTTCAPYQNTWELRARKINLSKETGLGNARHARLYVKDIPIFYLPYIEFPIDDRRITGFLFPVVGVTNTSGLELATPFYWDLAPHYDATLTPRYLSRRGFQGTGQFRYLLPTGISEVQADYLPYDRLYRHFKNDHKNDPRYISSDPRRVALNRGGDARVALLAKNTSSFNRYWKANVHYQVVGDDNYFMDLGNTLGLAGTTQVLQQGELTYQDEYWLGKARLQSYQTLYPYFGPVNAIPYKRLPQLAFKYADSPLPYCLGLQGQTEYTHFMHPRDPFTLERVTTGNRFHARPGITYPMVCEFGFFKPRIQLDILAYSLSLGDCDVRRGQPKNPGRSIPMFDIDSGLIFERPIEFCQTAFTQTLEPRAYYLNVPYYNQSRFPNFDTTLPGFDLNQLYRDNRFSGLDRLGDTNQLTLGLTSRFLCASNGVERLHLSVGQIYYFKKRRVLLGKSQVNNQFFEQELPNQYDHYSAIAGLGRLQFVQDWYANLGLEWNPNYQKVDKTSFWVQYQPTDLNVINLGYQFLRHNPAKLDTRSGRPERLQQVDASTAWVLNEQWRLLGRVNYDIRHQRINETLMGLEHQGCCTAVRLSLTRYLRPNSGQKKYSNGIFFQFVFKGLAGVGHNQLSSTLSKAIPGYQWRGETF